MAVKNLETLGHIKCKECSEQCTVHQTARGKEKNLYTRCPNCKADQRTGAVFQTRLWNETTWLPGKKPEKPHKAKEADWTPGDDRSNRSSTGSPTGSPTGSEPVIEPDGAKSRKPSVFGVLSVIVLVVVPVLFFIVKPKAAPAPQDPAGGYYGGY